MKLDKAQENISAISAPMIGVAGEVRCIITKADGTVKTDTGYQKNLILNQGLDFFGGGKGSYINASCAIGSGNSTPDITQTKLDTFIALADGTSTTSSYSYVDTGDGLYRMWEQNQYRFSGLGDININELGLVSYGNSSANYYLTTRVLPKDSLGAPTSLSLKAGETLDIYYKIHRVVDTRDKAFVINVLNGDGGSVPYNAVVRPSYVGSAINTRAGHFASPLVNSNAAEFSGTRLSSANIEAITATNTGNLAISSSNTSPYQAGSYKIKFIITADLNTANSSKRSIVPQTTMGGWQVRLGRVSDDAPLTKTNKDTLSIPLEFSWGRYEGTL